MYRYWRWGSARSQKTTEKKKKILAVARIGMRKTAMPMMKERMKKMTSTMEKRVSTIHHGSSAPRNPLWTKSTNSSDLRQKIYFQFSLIVTYIYWYWTMVPRPIAPNSLFLLFKWLKSHFFGKKCTSKKKKKSFSPISAKIISGAPSWCHNDSKYIKSWRGS